MNKRELMKKYRAMQKAKDMEWDKAAKVSLAQKDYEEACNVHFKLQEEFARYINGSKVAIEDSLWHVENGTLKRISIKVIK